MTEEYRILPLDLRYPEELARLKQFLAEQELTYESDIQAAFGIVDASEELVACGCAAGSLLKCFAVRPELRGQNALGLLVSQLVQERFARGIYRLFIITRAKNRALFAHCGFTPVAETPELVLLENSSGGPQAFTAPLFVPGDENKTIGCLVMNCNPFTLGHRALVEYASGQCDGVHLFVVEEQDGAWGKEYVCREILLPNVSAQEDTTLVYADLGELPVVVSSTEPLHDGAVVRLS